MTTDEMARDQREAAEKRAQASQQGRDVKPATKPDSGLVER